MVDTKVVDNVKLKVDNLEKRAERGVRELRKGIAPSSDYNVKLQRQFMGL